MLIFDIETGPLPDDRLRAIQKPFNPADVKLGNIKDESLKAKKIAEAEASYFDDYKADAALSAATGQVVAVGFRDTSSGICAIAGIGMPNRDGTPMSELDVIEIIWRKYAECRSPKKKGQLPRSMVGHNIINFDIPFLANRSQINKIPVPATLMTPDWRYCDKLFIDIRRIWLCGRRESDVQSSLDHIARAMGVGQKPDDVEGADFARLWFSESVEDRKKAEGYLLNDLEITANIAARMGLV